MNIIQSLEKTLEHYELPEKSPIVLLRESGDNFVYLVGTHQKHIVRVSKRLPVSDIIFEYEVLKMLNDRNVAVAEIKETKDGKCYSTIENDLIVVVFKFINGHHIQVDKDHLPTKIQAYDAGRFLSSIHNAGMGFITESPRQRNIFKELERVIALRDHFSNSFEGGKDFVSQVTASLEFGKTNHVQEGLIHNDFRPSNVFFDADKVVGVVDFDWACIGPIIKDLALAVVEWSFPDGATEVNDEIFDSFLAGYNFIAKNPIEKDEQLYRWIQFTTLSDAATYFCDLAEDPLSTKRVIKSYMYRKYLFFSNYIK